MNKHITEINIAKRKDKEENMFLVFSANNIDIFDIIGLSNLLM